MRPEDDERWQAYDEQGQPIPNQGLTRQQAGTGLLHGASHIWIWREHADGIEVLLQKRAETSDRSPGYFDVSAAGHISLAETPLQAAVRELHEELGLTIDPSELRLLFVFREKMEVEGTDIIDNELQWVYGLRLAHEGALDDAQGEVKTVAWTAADDIDLVIAGEANIRIVPHSAMYFSNVLDRIEHIRDETR